MQDLAVVTCHFNWSDSFTLDRLLKEFLEEMSAQNIQVYGVELSLSGKFLTSNNSTWQRVLVKKENISLQKSCLINKIVKSLPDNFTKIAWIDRDIIFKNPNWYSETSESLERFKVVQMFTKCFWLDVNNNPYLEANSCFSNFRNGTHDGFALAARRELWNHGGLYVYTPLGSGDAVFTNAARGSRQGPGPLAHACALRVSNLEMFKKWDQAIRTYVNKDVGMVNGEVYHKWHGSLENRVYGGRFNILKDIVINEHLVVNDEGILEFRNVTNEFLTQIKNYFIERQDDSTG